MGSPGKRFSASPLVVGLALFGAMACGGAASTPLDQPSTTGGHGGDDMSGKMHDATSGSSSSGGGHEDATVPDEASLDDATVDAADDGDDGGQGVDEGGPPEAGSLCAMGCAPGNRCCMMPGAISYGQCYSILCGACCF
jgi:hypothetical protein